MVKKKKKKPPYQLVSVTSLIYIYTEFAFTFFELPAWKRGCSYFRIIKLSVITVFPPDNYAIVWLRINIACDTYK